MALISFLITQLLAYSSWIGVLVIVVLSTKWMLSRKKHLPDPFAGLPEIKPHWFWGNVSSIFGSDHFVTSYWKHYKVLLLSNTMQQFR